jgi:hypothetical protein
VSYCGSKQTRHPVAFAAAVRAMADHFRREAATLHDKHERRHALRIAARVEAWHTELLQELAAAVVVPVKVAPLPSTVAARRRAMGQ